MNLVRLKFGGRARTEFVFIHSPFRCGSTWVFEQFRRLKSTYTFYEIFHERLADITPTELAEFDSEFWASKHPRGAPYFAEFEPLLNLGGGILGFEPNFSYARMTPGPRGEENLSVAETHYISRLIRLAKEKGKIPVLTGCRTLPRLAAIKRGLGGFHIVLQRRLLDQWNSYVRLYDEGSFYFLNSLIEILANSRHDPYQSDLFNRFVLARPCGKDARILRFEDWNSALKAFLHLHLYHYRLASGWADVIFDIDECAADRDFAALISRRIELASGLRPCLEDAISPPRSESALRGSWSHDLVREALTETGVAVGAGSRAPAQLAKIAGIDKTGAL